MALSLKMPRFHNLRFPKEILPQPTSEDHCYLGQPIHNKTTLASPSSPLGYGVLVINLLPFISALTDATIQMSS